jgi:beta-phosphoglucomutase-like phosphatase (HAD superfamily)
VTLGVVLLDLEGTLVRGGQLMEHVLEALDALRDVRVKWWGWRLPLSLVSNYTMPAGPGPIDPAVIAALIAEYRAIVNKLGLTYYFEPPAHHITLSSEVGVEKPDPQIFRVALARLGLPREFAETMFITEDAAHVAAARRLGMMALQLGVDITDWSQPPVLAAFEAGDTDPAHVRAAYALRLRVLYGEHLVDVQRVDLAARRTYVTLAGTPPRAAVLELDLRGDIAALQLADEAPHTRAFHEALEDTAAVAPAGAALAPGQTHTIEPGPAGHAPRRKRFSIT